MSSKTMGALRPVQATVGGEGGLTTGKGTPRSRSEKSFSVGSVSDLHDKENESARARLKHKVIANSGQALKSRSAVDKSTTTDSAYTIDAGENTDVTLIVNEDSATVAEMLTSERPSATYWRLLAERLAKELDESREQNLRLCLELGKKNEQCRDLQRLADDGVYYANLLRETMADDDSGLYEGENDDDQQQ